MFLQLLALVDLLAAVSLLLSAFGFPLPHLQATVAIALGGKALLFINDVLSIIDLCIALTMFVLLWLSSPTIALVLGGYMALKSLYTFATTTS